MTTQTHPIKTLGSATIVELPPLSSAPAIDSHTEEEVYVGLSGSGGVVLDEPEPRTVLLTPGRLVRVPPSVRRTLTSAPGGLRVLVVGGALGEASAAPS